MTDTRDFDTPVSTDFPSLGWMLAETDKDLGPKAYSCISRSMTVHEGPGAKGPAIDVVWHVIDVRGRVWRFIGNETRIIKRRARPNQLGPDEEAQAAMLAEHWRFLHQSKSHRTPPKTPASPGRTKPRKKAAKSSRGRTRPSR